MLFAPLIWIRRTALSAWPTGFVFAFDPGWVVPSMEIAAEIGGRSVVGAIVWTPDPGMLKAITPPLPTASASRIAWRNEPGPESLVLVTVKVDSRRRPSIGSTSGRRRCRWDRPDGVARRGDRRSS
jgi:hypothetical protein